MERFLMPLLLLLALALVACKKEEPLDSAELPDASDVVAEFHSHALGAYRLLINARLDEAISTYPLDAAIPELLKLEKEYELEKFLEKSQLAGFDKNQFDVLNQATFTMIEALRLFLVTDMNNGRADSWSGVDLRPLVDENLNIVFTRDNGSKGKDKKFSYRVDQLYILPHCTLGPATCELTIDIDITFYFPVQNPSITPSALKDELFINDMNVNISVFKIANQYASLDFASSVSNNMRFTFGSVFYRKNSDVSLVSQDYASLDIWDDGNDSAFSLSNFLGVFTNQYTDENGKAQTVKVTGLVDGSIERFGFYANYGGGNEENQPLHIIEFEEDNNVEPRSAFADGTMTGFIDGVDLTVELTTELVDSE